MVFHTTDIVVEPGGPYKERNIFSLMGRETPFACPLSLSLFSDGVDCAKINSAQPASFDHSPPSIVARSKKRNTIVRRLAQSTFSGNR